MIIRHIGCKSLVCLIFYEFYCFKYRTERYLWYDIYNRWSKTFPNRRTIGKPRKAAD